jgi:hypothetical protein
VAHKILCEHGLEVAYTMTGMTLVVYAGQYIIINQHKFPEERRQPTDDVEQKIQVSPVVSIFLM